MRACVTLNTKILFKFTAFLEIFLSVLAEVYEKFNCEVSDRFQAHIIQDLQKPKKKQFC
jgi:hypothetical protein